MNTRLRILEEALRQFNKKGIHQVGVREIARSLNMSPGNLSYHFPKKEDLLLEIIRNYSKTNKVYREGYLNGKPCLIRFIQLFEKTFHNQFQHRGIFTELVEVNRILKESTGFDYTISQTERINEFENMVETLQEVGELKLGSEIKTNLVSFLTLFGRFWISEAFLAGLPKGQEETVNHYISILKHQLILNATPFGVKSLK